MIKCLLVAVSITRVVGLVALMAVATFASVASTSLGATSCGAGVLRTFAPQSATTWWAIVDSNLSARSYVVRTTDGGTHWQNLTPPVGLIVSTGWRRSAGRPLTRVPLVEG